VPRDRLIYFNFEDERLEGLRAEDLGLILEEYYRQFPAYRHREQVTFCFDEIQMVAGWERFIRRILDAETVEVFVSGSSAKLLSREVATSMRGRAMETVITPFSFREFLLHHGIETPASDHLIGGGERSRLQKAFDDYMRSGGFPEAQSLDDRDRIDLLQGYVDLVLFRDVVERHEIANVTALRAFIRHVLQQPGAFVSISKLYNDFKSQGIAVSKDTLSAFLGYLEDSFLLRALEMHSVSERQRRVNPRKVYLADHTLSAAYRVPGREDRKFHLENVVACELFRRGRSAHYCRTDSGREVDFLVQEHSGNVSLIQVSADIDQADTLERECRALMEAGDRHEGAALLLLTESDGGDYELPSDRIEAIPVWRWLCGESQS